MNSLPQTTHEQRSQFYEDVEALIEAGFLYHTLSINGVRFVLRSLGPGDLFMLQARATGDVESNWQTWALATSVWMVNGVNLLDEPHAPVRMFETIKNMPRVAQDILFSLAMGLFARQNRATLAVEAYSYETISRFKWKGFNGHTPGHYSGVPGSDRLGLNYVQQMWAVFNEVEDRRQTDQGLWEGFKLVASAMAPKGIKKIDQKETQMKTAEDERRQAVRDRFYYIAIGLLMPDGKAKEGLTPYITFTKTPEQLADEMHNWVTGKEDSHDQVVSSYKRQVIEKYQSEKEAREVRQADLRDRLDKQQALGGEMERPLVGYTGQQLAEILKKRGPGRSGVTHIYDSDRDDREYLYEKYLERNPDAGLLRGDGDSLEMAPGGKDFTEAVADRPVPFKTGPGEE